MATARTCLLVHDGTLSDLAPAWEADRRTEGWQVLPSLAETDLDRLRKRLDGLRPDHTFLAGDAVPRPTATANPDGHYSREVCADYSLVSAWGGAVGRLWFARQSSADTDSAGLYRRYFAKRSVWAKQDYGLTVSFDDHLGNIGGMFIEWSQAVRQQIPSSVLDYLNLGPVYDDGVVEALQASPRLMLVILSGGQPFANPGGFYYAGGHAIWRAADPEVPILIGFASFLCELDWDNSMLTAALTTGHTLVSLYNMQGLMPFGGMFAGMTAGDVGRQGAQAAGPITNVYGDPTVSLSADTVAGVQIMQRLQALEGRVGVLENRPAPVTVTPAAPVTITSGPASAPAGIVRTAGEDWAGLADDNRKHSPVIPSAFPFPASTFDTYDVARGGFIEYRLPAAGPCTVTLALCEPYHSTAGQRPMVVSANGEQVITNLDPATAAGGSFRAVAKSFSASPVGGVVVVRVSGMPGAADMNPCVAGIKVEAAG